MKKLMLLFALAICFNTYAQDVVPDYTYCQIVGKYKFLSTDVVVSIDYGQGGGYFGKNRIFDEVTGKVKDFNSMVDALNYMGEKGWEFVQAYTVTMGNSNVYHYMLKRKLTDEEKKEYIPFTKRDIKK